MKPRVLAIDPGFEWLGWSVVAMGDVVDTVLAMGLLRTRASSKKRHVLVRDDMFRRAQEIASELLRVIRMYQVGAVAFEAYSPVRSSSVCGKLGHAYGVVATLTVVLAADKPFGLPVASAGPEEVRRAVGSASKEDTKRVVKARLRSSTSRSTMREFEREHGRVAAEHTHAWDSLAVYLACRESDVLRALRIPR